MHTHAHTHKYTHTTYTGISFDCFLSFVVDDVFEPRSVNFALPCNVQRYFFVDMLMVVLDTATEFEDEHVIGSDNVDLHLPAQHLGV